MDLHDWVNRCREEYIRREDNERMQMTTYRERGFEFRERDTDYFLSLLQQGRKRAMELGEPLWVLYYDAFYLEALVEDKHDYRQALDLAVKSTLEARKPMYEGCPVRFVVCNIALSAYIGVDPLGYEEAIENTIAYMDAEVPRGSNSDRHVLVSRKRRLAMARGDWEAARTAALETFYLLDGDTDTTTVNHYSGAAESCLCKILMNLGDWDALEETAHSLERHARKADQQRNIVEAKLWQAVILRRREDETSAKKLLRQVITGMAKLSSPPTAEYFDAFVQYYELGGEIQRAILFREKQLERISGHGQFAYECVVHIDRCRLLKKMQQLTDTDLQRARDTTRPLRKPGYYLQRIERLCEG